MPIRPVHVALLLLLLLLPATRLRAQLTPPPGAQGVTGWSPIGIGIRIGYDNTQQRQMVGGLLRLPVLPSGVVELLPNAEVTFLPGTNDYQLNFEAAYLTMGRRGGLYAGGGVGFRNGLFSPDPNASPRWEQTFSVVAGARFGGLGRFRPELETRWILAEDLTRDPRQVAIGVSVALW